MSLRSRDLLVLGGVALLARAVAVALVPWPPFTDPAYYSLVGAAARDRGHGFTTPVLWSFLEVGSRIPDPAVLPIPSNAHWMPLTSIVAAGIHGTLRTDLRGRDGAAHRLLRAARAVHVPRDAGSCGASAGRRSCAAVLALFAGPLLLMYPTSRQLRGLRRHRSRIPVLRDAGGQRRAAGAVARRGRRCWRGWRRWRASTARCSPSAVATAWFVRRGWSPWRVAGDGRRDGWPGASRRPRPSSLSWRRGSRGTSPCSASVLPSTGGHTLWITSYNEQFSIGHEVSAATYFEWGWANIIGSKLVAWGELVGSHRRCCWEGRSSSSSWPGCGSSGGGPTLRRSSCTSRVMFFVMGAVFTFHAPKGAFYHSAPAWLPWAFGICRRGDRPGLHGGRPVLAVPAADRRRIDSSRSPGSCGAVGAVAHRLGDALRANGTDSRVRDARGRRVPSRQRRPGRRA